MGHIQNVPPPEVFREGRRQLFLKSNLYVKEEQDGQVQRRGDGGPGQGEGGPGGRREVKVDRAHEILTNFPAKGFQIFFLVYDASGVAFLSNFCSALFPRYILRTQPFLL